MPIAIDAVAAAAAPKPIGSTDVDGSSTSAPTPMTPTAPDARPTTVGRNPSTGHPTSSTTMGPIAADVAATPPGTRSAAVNSSTKKRPMLSTPSVATRRRQPAGGMRRVTSASASPAGSARPAAANSGRSAGSSSVATQYEVPQTSGATAVCRMVRSRR